MKIIICAALAAAQVAAAPPAFAAGVQRDAAIAGGAFAGLRLRVPLGGSRADQSPRLGLAFAPTLRSTGENGDARTRIGEGLEFGFSGSRQTLALTMAGQRLGAAQDEDGGDGGISTLGWIAIGTGVIVVAFATAFVIGANNSTQ